MNTLKFQLMLRREDSDLLDRLCAARRMNRSAFVRELIHQYAKENEAPMLPAGPTNPYFFID